MADAGGEVNMQESASDSDMLREFRYRWPGEEHLAPIYDSAENFTLEINYSGHLLREDKKYVMGSVCWADWHCVKSFSLSSLYDEATKLSYDSATVKIYFRDPVHNGGFVEIDNDKMVTKFVESKYRNEKGFAVVYLFEPSEPNAEERVEEPHLEEHASDIHKESDEVHEEVQNQGKIDQSDEEDEYEAILRDSDYEQSDVEINEKSEDYQLGEQSENEDGDYIVHPGEEESDYGNSELLESGEDSSTESGDMDDSGCQNQGDSVNKRRRPKIILPKFRLWNNDKDLRDPKFELGLHFADVKQVRSAVIEYSLKNGRNLKLRPNDQRRVRAMRMGVTTKKCPFYFYASLKNRKSEDKTFVVKKWYPKHTCCRTTKNRFATSVWLAERFSDLIIGNPCITTQDFTKHVLKDYRIDVTRWQVYCAKKIALKQNTGAMEAQYGSLHDYAMELLDRNPGSTIIIKKTGEEPNLMFQRIYICFNALKQGFKDGCRRMVGLDGCHLKGRYKGQLLTAVGIDANNGMFPVAYAVVESEDTDSWTWFMELFIDDVAIMNEGLGWVIISDKQKGLKNCINTLLPEVEHRFCVRHLHENFKLDGHVGNLLKQQLWTTARTTTQPWFRKEMEVMQKMSTTAHDWLMVRPATQWSRSHFQTHSKCDIMLNNLCEAFNKALLSARKLSIISMLEEIRVYLMLRMSKQREVEWNQVVGPRIMGILEKNQLAATECSNLYAGNMTYEVQSSGQRTFAVDLGKKTCSCRRWELCGLPCPHAIRWELCGNYLAKLEHCT